MRTLFGCILTIVLISFLGGCGGSKADYQKKQDTTANEKTTPPAAPANANETPEAPATAGEKAKPVVATDENLEPEEAPAKRKIKILVTVETREPSVKADETPASAAAQAPTTPAPAAPMPAAPTPTAPAPASSSSAQPTMPASAIVRIKLQRRVGVFADENLVARTDVNFHPAIDSENPVGKDSHGNPIYSAFDVGIQDGSETLIKFDVRDESTDQYKYTVTFKLSAHFGSDAGAHDQFTVVREDLLNDQPNPKVDFWKPYSQNKTFFLAALETNEGPRQISQEHPEWCKTKLHFDGEFSLFGWSKDAYTVNFTYIKYLAPTPTTPPVTAKEQPVVPAIVNQRPTVPPATPIPPTQVRANENSNPAVTDPAFEDETLKSEYLDKINPTTGKLEMVQMLPRRLKRPNAAFSWQKWDPPKLDLKQAIFEISKLSLAEIIGLGDLSLNQDVASNVPKGSKSRVFVFSTNQTTQHQRCLPRNTNLIIPPMRQAAVTEAKLPPPLGGHDLFCIPQEKKPTSKIELLLEPTNEGMVSVTWLRSTAKKQIPLQGDATVQFKLTDRIQAGQDFTGAAKDALSDDLDFLLASFPKSSQVDNCGLERTFFLEVRFKDATLTFARLDVLTRHMTVNQFVNAVRDGKANPVSNAAIFAKEGPLTYESHATANPIVNQAAAIACQEVHKVWTRCLKAGAHASANSKCTQPVVDALENNFGSLRDWHYKDDKPNRAFARTRAEANGHATFGIAALFNPEANLDASSKEKLDPLDSRQVSDKAGSALNPLSLQDLDSFIDEVDFKVQ